MTTTDWVWIGCTMVYAALFWVLTLRVVAWLDRRDAR